MRAFSSDPHEALINVSETLEDTAHSTEETS
jgi:hypothetical protein